MTLRALRDDDTAAMEGHEIPSWVGACPQEGQNDSASLADLREAVSCDSQDLSSGVKDIGPDDTVEQREAPRHVRRRTGPRKRVTLKADTVRDALERQYRDEGQWDELVDLYMGRIEAVEPPEKVELFKRLGDVLWQELGDATAARDALVEALSIDPSDEDAASHLEDIAASRDGGWKALVDAVAQKIDVIEGNPAKARLAERVVRWARGDMNDAAIAERHLTAMRSYDPAHPLVHERMASVYAGKGAWDEQRESLERALARTQRNEDRRAIHIALGELFEERLPNAKRAADSYEKALALDPRAMAALCGMERICRTTEQYVRLAAILDQQVDAATGDAERVGALVRLGELLEQRFVRPRDAIPKYELALELEPENARALDGLERCWHQTRDWERLAAALERRAASTSESRDAIATLMRLAEVREAKQESIDLALAAWRRLYELDTSHVMAIQQLARLSEKLGDITAGAAYRARLADLTDDPREKARIHIAVGEMLAPEGCDPGCARIHFERAVEMDPRSPVAWEQLQKLAVRERDMMYATFCLERRAEHTDSVRLKAQLLVELAKMRLSLGDGRGALATFEYAFETDPTNETAARAVLEDWSRREKWEDAQRACDVLVAAATRDADPKLLFKLLRLSTRIALALGNGERALMAAAAAYDLCPADGAAQSDVLHVCFQLRDRPSLRDRVGAVAERVAKEAMDLSPESLVRLGEVRLKTGDPHGGVELLCLALSHDGGNPQALAGLTRVFSERRDWGRAANCMHRLARVTEDPRERQARFLEAADVWEKQANIPVRAVNVLEEALERDPRDTAVLHRLVALWGTLGDWEKLIGALHVLGGLEQDPARRAKHVYASAGVAREKIGDARRATRLYEEVLELDASRLDAFERLVRIWTDLRDWRELELGYRRMIGRVADSRDKKLEHALYHQLGLVYRDRIGDMPRALDAFRRAAKLAPEDDEDRRIIVELLVLSGQPELAIADMRRSLKVDPTRPSTLRELYELFLRQGLNDRAWCAANALVHLGEADEAQHKFVADFPPIDLTSVPGTLAACAWPSHVMAPGVDERLTAIFRFLVPAVVRARMARVPEKSRIKWLGAQVRETDSPLAARLVQITRDGAEILGVPPPLLLARPQLSVPFAVAPTPTPALFVSLPAAGAVPEELLVFLVGRRLAELRPELVAHALFPTLTELKSLMKAALRVAVATRGSPPANADDAAIARALDPHEMDGLREAVSAIVGTDSRADIRQWHQQADLTIARAALLLTGDFELAWRGIQREPRSPSDLTPADWRGEMLQFAMSDEYADLREAIGVGVEGR
jgi:tetratricopeptide (TPR) repeat protein